MFPGAATGKISSYPHFQGRKIAQTIGADFLTFSDPGLSVSSKVATSWCTGTAEQNFFTEIPPIIRHFCGNRRILFMGISAGGVGALHFNSQFDNCISFVINARTSLITPPSSFFASSKRLYPGLTIEQIESILPLTPAEPSNDVVYAQNINDHVYLAGNCLPYLREFTDSGKVYYILGNWAVGHYVMPRNELLRYCETLIDADTVADVSGKLHLTSSASYNEVLRFAGEKMQRPNIIRKLREARN